VKNKKYFVFLGIVFLCLASCEKIENPIPVSRVYLNLDLTFEDKELKAVPAYKEYTIKNINLAQGERAGYGGVLVVHTMLGEYKAFDRSCSYEAKPGITVEVDEEILYAVCPVCKTKYDIGFGTGAPNGKSKHYLRIYNVTQNGGKLIVGN
jgi:nitrite reductase/ring-hydroxylating ferredoxin subunit